VHALTAAPHFARRILSFILSTMSDRSSSAMLPTMVRNMRPIGPLVSIASLAETNSMLTFSSSTISRKFFEGSMGGGMNRANVLVHPTDAEANLCSS
jgi:hypothetical protein